jgi:hypothetical protein
LFGREALENDRFSRAFAFPDELVTLNFPREQKCYNRIAVQEKAGVLLKGGILL